MKPGKRKKEIVKNGRMKSENKLRTFRTENHKKGKIKKKIKTIPEKCERKGKWNEKKEKKKKSS